MIQRKQTLYLIVVVAAYVLSLFLPVGGFEPQGMGAEVLLHNMGVVRENGATDFLSVCIPLFLLLAVPAVLSLVTIFLYRNRPLQMTLCSVSLLFTVLWYVDYALLAFGIVALDNIEGSFRVHYAAVFPLVSIVFLVLARKGVSDDEKLIKAADRIR